MSVARAEQRRERKALDLKDKKYGPRHHRWRRVYWTIEANVYEAFTDLHEQFKDLVPSEEDWARVVIKAGIDYLNQGLAQAQARDAEASTLVKPATDAEMRKLAEKLMEDAKR